MIVEKKKKIIDQLVESQETNAWKNAILGKLRNFPGGGWRDRERYAGLFGPS